MSFGYFGYDTEVPAGYQDADIEMAELEAQANDMENRPIHTVALVIIDDAGGATLEREDIGTKLTWDEAVSRHDEIMRRMG